MDEYDGFYAANSGAGLGGWYGGGGFGVGLFGYYGTGWGDGVGWGTGDGYGCGIGFANGNGMSYPVTDHREDL